MKKRIAWIMVVVMVFAVFAVGCGARGGDSSSTEGDTEGQTYTIRLAYDVAESHASHIAAEEVFVPMIEEGSGGAITVELYPNSQLGAVPECIETMRTGGVEMAWGSDADIAGFVDEWNLVGLPYLWTSLEAAHDALDGDFGQELSALMEEQCGVKVLTIPDVGFRNITNSKRPIEGAEDLKGMKIRTMTNTLHLEYFEALGAIPTPMNFSEVFTALQQGTVDGQENPTAMIWNNRLYEAQKYMTISEHVFTAAPIMISMKFWDTLPEEYQTLIQEAADATRDRQREIITQQNEEYAKNIADAGVAVTTLSDDAKAEFQKIAEDTVYKTAAASYGQELIDMAAAHNK